MMRHVDIITDRIKRGEYSGREKRSLIKNDLICVYELEDCPMEKTDLLFWLSWEYGHSGGLYEVLFFFDDMVRLIK